MLLKRHTTHFQHLTGMKHDNYAVPLFSELSTACHHHRHPHRLSFYRQQGQKLQTIVMIILFPRFSTVRCDDVRDCVTTSIRAHPCGFAGSLPRRRHLDSVTTCQPCPVQTDSSSTFDNEELSAIEIDNFLFQENPEAGVPGSFSSIAILSPVCLLVLYPPQPVCLLLVRLKC